MKQASLLIVLCALFGLSAFAQSTTTVEKNAKRITITTKKTDENGKTITETYIAEGEEPAKILEGMAVNPEIIQQVEVINPSENEERLFLIRTAGDNVVIEGTLNENINEDMNGEGEKQRIIIINKDKGKGEKECYKFMRTHEGFGEGASWARHDRKSNCAALGVYVVTDGEKKGSRISSLIEEGGAQAAGLREGDVITRIEEFDVEDFATLHVALSHFQPGDVVTVRYSREGDSKKSKVELKDWNQLPGHEWRSRNDCGQAKVEEVEPAQTIINQPAVEIQKLELQDAQIFPNPTEGVFALSFRTEPGPVSVTITDVNGKVIYQEENDNPSGSYKKEIDLKGIPQGNYVISVKQGDKVFTEQISKQ